MQRAVYDALLEERQLEIRYRARGRSRAGPRTIHPLGLILEDGVAYLVARLWNYDDPVHLALHRIEAAEPIAGRVQYPNGFDFGEHVETDAEFSYPTGYGTMRLEVRFRDGVGEHLRERPLSDDQAIREGPDGTLLLGHRRLRRACFALPPGAGIGSRRTGSRAVMACAWCRALIRVCAGAGGDPRPRVGKVDTPPVAGRVVQRIEP